MRLPLLVRAAAAESPRDCRIELEVMSHFEHSRTSLLRYLYSMGLPGHDAEEVVQDVFLALFQHLRLGRDGNNLRAWLFRVSHNLGLKRRMASLRAPNPPDESIFHQQTDPRPNPEQQVRARQRRERLLAVVEAFPEQDRSCLHLRAEGLRYREIADALGISLGAVAQSLTRSLERLHRADERL
jgi:RNA polymerase sigma-70 factor (ECF subfamily)